jgi:hypothetical protein
VGKLTLALLKTLGVIDGFYLVSVSFSAIILPLSFRSIQYLSIIEVDLQVDLFELVVTLSLSA